MKAFEICFWGVLCVVMAWATWNAVEMEKDSIVFFAALTGMSSTKFSSACMRR